jgi:hypothetical protein
MLLRGSFFFVADSERHDGAGSFPFVGSLYQPPPPPPPPPPPEQPSLPEEEPGAVEDDAMDPERSDAKEDANAALKAPAGIDPEYHEGA